MRSVVKGVLAISLVLHAGQARAQTPPEAPAIGPLRYNEDYSYLRDPEKRAGAWWEPLKYSPIGEKGWAYATVGDAWLLSDEAHWNYPFGPREHEHFLFFRASPYLDLHAGEHLRAFGQLQAGWAGRPRETKVAGADETGVDLLQGFLDWRIPTANSSFTLRAGRQVLNYGGARLVAPGKTILRSFDGSLVRWEAKDWTIDGFYLRPVNVNFGFFDDSPDSRRRLWSAYATRTLTAIGPRGGYDLYYFGYENEQAQFFQGAGHERRHIFGARFFGQRKRWEWDAETNLQTGTFDNAAIRAGFVAVALRYALGGGSRRPYLSLRTSYTSGDGDLNDGRLGTFNALFPALRYFGDIALFGPNNLTTLRPTAGFSIVRNLTFALTATLYWRSSVHDGLYGPALNPLLSGAVSNARFVGYQEEAELLWILNRNLNFRFVYNSFQPGLFARDSGIAETVHLGLIDANFAF